MSFDNGLLVHLLTEQGRTWQEIEQIFAELDEHDRRTIRESVFDSIQEGSFSLDDVIAEAKNAVRAHSLMPRLRPR